MENKRILVIGGTGYIGRILTEKLASHGYQPIILSRNPQIAKPAVKGSVLDKDFLCQNLKNFELVIYLTAVIKSLKKKKYRENIIGLQNAITAMKANNLKRLVYFSTQNVHLKKTGPYGNSKRASEKIIRDSGLDYLIIRPNYVYGLDKNNYFYQLYKIMRTFKVCPIIGRGQNLIEPVNKDDLAEITIGLLAGWQPKREIDVSGKTTLSVREAIELIKKSAGLKCLAIKIPIWLIRPFKYLIPFDIDGQAENKIPPTGAAVIRGTANLEEDFKKITDL